MGNGEGSRLPRFVRPRRYELVIEPDLDTSVFTGTVAIALDVDEPVREVVVNARDLDISEAWVEHGNDRTDATVRLDAAEERAHVQLPTELPAGQAVLHCAFTGKLHDDLVGFYRSRYTGTDGEEHTIAATQFE